MQHLVPVFIASRYTTHANDLIHWRTELKYLGYELLLVSESNKSQITLLDPLRQRIRFTITVSDSGIDRNLSQRIETLFPSAIHYSVPCPEVTRFLVANRLQLCVFEKQPLTPSCRSASQFILSNLSSVNLSIASVSEAMGTTVDKLQDDFQRSYFLSVWQFVIEQRMRIAKELVLDTTFPIADICLAVGYDDQSNFTRAFKQYTGYSPTKIRSLKD